MILVPFNWMTDVALTVAPVIVPDAVILVAPEIAPAVVIPPLLLVMPPWTLIPPADTVKPPVVIVCPNANVFAWSRYATLLNVPPVLISVPFSCNADVAFKLATVNFASVPLSVKVNKVFGVPSASLIVKTPLTPVVAKVSAGAALESVSGDALERLTVPEAAMVVAPEIAPTLVILPELLFKPPVIEAPPAEMVKPPLEIVCAAVNVLD